MAVDSMMTLFERLHLLEKSAVSLGKLHPDYVLHVDSQAASVCAKTTAKVAATSSNHSIRLYTRTNLASTGTIKGHDKVLTGVRFAHTSPDLLYSSSQDGTIRCWDLRESTTEAAYTYEGYSETNNVFTAFDLSADDRILCAGTEANKDGDTHLIFWDARNADQLGVYSESHVEDITQVRFHPTDPNRLITGSVDGLVNVFDITEESEDDALMTSLNTESSVSLIGWCGKAMRHVYCATHIETFHIWETLSDEFATLTNLDIREKFEDGTGDYLYLVDCLQPPDSDIPVLVCGSKSGQLYLKSVTMDNLEPLVTLDGGHNDVVRCLSWDPKDSTLISGGEDAMLCLWSNQQLGSETASDTKTGRAKPATKMRTRMKTRISSGPF